MHIEQIYTGCLAQGAYYIESEGEVAIIDPLRETQPYLERSKKRGAEIRYIFETHFHADFVSGHVELAKKTGARIIFGPGAKTEYAIHEATDGETFSLGKVLIKALHTPGHTLESTCYLLLNESGEEQALFSGDTLFIGDVGRPDLAQNGSVNREDLAGMLFDSLRNKIMPLSDQLTVYPAHGAGSACGKNMSKETTDLLGNQKKTNYALRGDMTREEFIREVTDGLLPPPVYFAQNVAMNMSGAENLENVMKQGNIPLTVDAFEALANQGALVLDTRKPQEYAAAHIPNSVYIGIDGNFAPWAGALIPDLKQSIIFIAPENREEEVVLRLSRVGYDNTLGFLQGGIEAWTNAGKEIDSVESITAEEFANRPESKVAILDVRKPAEFDAGHLEGAINMPLDYINDEMDRLDHQKPYYIHCAGGYRSMIFASILKSRGIHGVVDIQGGYKAIEQTDLARTGFQQMNQ